MTTLVKKLLLVLLIIVLTTSVFLKAHLSAKDILMCDHTFIVKRLPHFGHVT